MKDKVFDTIVVGTGIGGLSSGLYLARRGHSVLLLEAAKQFGGMLNPFARKRYHFDVGIHYVGEAGPGQSVRRAFDHLGMDDLEFREINPDCIDRYVYDGYECNLVKGHDRWCENLCADFPKEADNIRRFIKLMEACLDLSRIAVKGPSAGRLARSLKFMPGLTRIALSPLSKVVEHYFDDPTLRNVFAGPGGDIGLPPSRASAFISLMVLNHFLQGGYYPVGGSGAMRDSFISGLKANDAELKKNTLVTRIEVLGDRRFAVETDKGDRFESRSVISNVDAVDTAALIDGARPNRHFRRKTKTLRPSLGSFAVFLGTDIDLTKTEVTDANIWHYGTNDLETGYAEALAGRITKEPYFFLTAPTLKDPATVRAPKGDHIVEMITFVPTEPFKPWWDKPPMKRGPEYAALKEEIADRLLEGAELYVPNLRDHIKHIETSTPATVWSYVRGREGGIYGPEHTPDQILHRRMFTSIGVPGLYLAGASVLGAGIGTCLSSGMMAGGTCRRHLTAK